VVSHTAVSESVKLWAALQTIGSVQAKCKRISDFDTCTSLLLDVFRRFVSMPL